MKRNEGILSNTLKTVTKKLFFTADSTEKGRLGMCGEDVGELMHVLEVGNAGWSREGLFSQSSILTINDKLTLTQKA